MRWVQVNNEIAKIKAYRRKSFLSLQASKLKTWKRNCLFRLETSMVSKSMISMFVKPEDEEETLLQAS